MKHISSFFTLLKDAFSSWQKDQVAMLGAALAYYSVFSMGPLLLVIIGLLGIFFGREAVSGHIYDQLHGLLGKDGANSIELMIAHAAKPKTGIISIIIGTITLILGALGVFGQLQQSFNLIWHVTPKSSSILGMLRERFLSFSALAVIGFLLGISLVASAAITAITHQIALLSGFILEATNFILSFLLLAVLFAFLYKSFSKVTLSWRQAFYGALIASILFTIGKTLIGIYIGNSSMSSTYGPSSAIVVILLWIYYTSQIMFFGIEFTKVYAKQHGLKVADTQVEIIPHEEADSHLKERKNLEASRQTFTMIGYMIVELVKIYRGTQKKKKKE